MRYLIGVLAFIVVLFGLLPAGADAPRQQPAAQEPAVSFSPAVVDFGMVPSNTQPTQLVTVTLDRRVFSDHLPTLVPDRDSQADVALFARFDGPDVIRLVYRVTINAYFQIGPFQDHLILVDNTEAPAPYPPGSAAENAGVSVVGESVQPLEGPALVDFGDVAVGKTKTKQILVGFSAPNMIRLNRGAPSPALKKFRLNFPHTPGLANMAVVSSSPDVTAADSHELGANASIFHVWTVRFRSHLPLGRVNTELQFKTQDGYCATVPVTAEVVGPLPPKSHTLKKQKEQR